MKLTKRQLKRMIKEEIDELAGDPILRIANRIGVNRKMLEDALKQDGLQIVSLEELPPPMSPDERDDYTATTWRGPKTSDDTKTASGKTGLPMAGRKS
jgi:hypothetical protein